jgi:hypothetical protein
VIPTRLGQLHELLEDRRGIGPPCA